MADEILKRDENHEPVIGLVTDDASEEIRMGRIDDATKGLKVMIVGGAGSGTVTSIASGTGILLTPDPIVTTGIVALATALQPIATLSGNSLKVLRVNAGETAVEYATVGAGTVTSVSVTTANGVSGSVATATTTPAITLTLGAITPTTVNGLTITANGTNTLSITAGKTLSIVKTMSFTAADDTGVYTLPTGTKTLLATDGAGTSLTGIPYTLTGTANQVTLSAGTGNITFSLPNDLRITSASVGTNADSIPTLSSTSTLTNKTLTSPTLGGVTSFADGATTKLIVPTVDGTATGPTTSAFVSGYTSSAIGDLVYLDSSGKWQKTDADAASTASNLLGIALAVAATDAALLVALPGSIVYATAFPTMTIGVPMYIDDTTAGAIKATIPTGADNVIRVVGFAVHADKLFFMPSSDNQVTVA